MVYTAHMKRLFFLLFLSWPLLTQGKDSPINHNPLRVTQSYLKHSSLPAGASTELTVKVVIDKGHRAYVEQFKIFIKSPIRSSVTDLLIHPKSKFYDKFSKKNKMGVIESAKIKTSFEIPEDLTPGKHQAVFALRYQACTEKYCLLPKTVDFRVPFTSLSMKSEMAQSLTPEEGVFSRFLNELDHKFKRAISNKDWLTLLLIAFLGGIATSFLPCIYPMIPITLTILGATQSGTSKLRAFVLSLCYVLGIALTYSLLGATAASTGKLFGALLGNTYVIMAMVILLIAMALSMFGLFEIKVPAFIAKKLGNKKTSANYLGAFFAGLIFGIIASPCVGPVLISILTYVAQTQNIQLGFILLFVFALGLGQLFILLGLSVQSIKRLPKSGVWMNSVKYLFGFIILLLAASYAYPLLPKSPSLAINQSIPWQEYTQENIMRAASEGKGVIIDFYADWCIACKELEAETFSHEQIQRLGQSFIWIKFDATKPNDEFHRLAKKYSILSLPHIVLYDHRGNYRKDLTLNVFEDHRLFSERMKKALQ